MSTEGHYIICLEPDSDEVYRFLVWLDQEWAYVMKKFGGLSYTTADDDFTRQGFSEDSWWFRQVMQYVDRARIYGLDTEKGRQAMAKATATMIAATATSVRVFGPLPRGGVTSGEITE